jgi:3-methyladenine DNA glycosylase AlkD
MRTLTAARIGSELRRHPPPNTSAWRVKRRAWSQELAGESPQELIRLGQLLINAGLRGRLTAYELIAMHPGGIAGLTPAAIRRLASGLCDWPGVDTFGCLIAGPAWREGRLGARQINSWARSQDRWQRRLALTCTVALNVRARGGRGDAARTLRVCRQLVVDRDDMVVKALSWALRALIRWDRAAVRQFIRDHEGQLAARIKREVGNKLRSGRKN